MNLFQDLIVHCRILKSIYPRTSYLNQIDTSYYLTSKNLNFSVYDLLKIINLNKKAIINYEIFIILAFNDLGFNNFIGKHICNFLFPWF